MGLLLALLRTAGCLLLRALLGMLLGALRHLLGRALLRAASRLLACGYRSAVSRCGPLSCRTGCLLGNGSGWSALAGGPLLADRTGSCRTGSRRLLTGGP